MLRTAALFLFGMGFLQIVFSITSMEVEPGQSATMWCSHDIHVSGNLYWFKQTDGAVPVTIVHMLYTESLQEVEPKYFNNFTKEHLVMYIHRKGTTLIIKTVSISDSAFYFCGPMGYHMAFGSGTRLEVKAHVVNATVVNNSHCIKHSEKNVISQKNDTEASKKVVPDPEQSPVSTEECPGEIFYVLTLVFGGIIFLICIVPLISAIIREHKRQRHKKVTHRQAQQHIDKDNDSVEYAAVHFKRPKTAGQRTEDTIVAYADATET